MIGHWLPAIRAQLEQLCDLWHVPLGVPVGWIEEESGGDPHSTTTLKEYGLFQIFPDESTDMHFDHDRIRVDQAYGIECGFRLMDRYRSFAIAHLRDAGADVPNGSELAWRFTKYAHSIGFGGAKTTMVDAGPMCSSWESFTEFCRQNQASLLHRIKHDPMKWIALVDRVFKDGAPYGLEQLWPAPQPVA